MANGGARPGSGRKLIPIDVEAMGRAASIGCTVDEMAALSKMKTVTFEKRMASSAELAEAVRVGRATGRATLRRMQWQQASKGNATMLIWLGKQMLGQLDKMAVTSEIPVTGEMTVDELRNLRQALARERADRARSADSAGGEPKAPGDLQALH